jgi:hypothetical protein
MSEVVAGIRIPDSKLAREATDLVREHSTPPRAFYRYRDQMRVLRCGGSAAETSLVRIQARDRPDFRR